MATSMVLRFVGLTKTDGKRFIEEQIYQPLGLYSPVLADGSLGLRRMNPILADAPYVAVLNEDSFTQVGALEHDYQSLMNYFSIDWNWDAIAERYTRRRIVIDQGSIDVHGQGETRELKWQGVHGSRHTDATLKQRSDSLRDRYSGPPLRLSGTLLHSYNRLEVGDVVRVQLENVRDYTGASGPLDRSMEIQRIAVDQVSGEVRVNLFGSSQNASVIPPDTGPALDDGWYVATGSPLSSVLSITANVVQPGSYNLTGHADLNNASAIYYHDGDLEIADGATITINDNVQLRIKGFLEVNGDIDGTARGFDGATEDGVLANQNAGTAGYIGSTRGWEGLRQYSAFSTQHFRRQLAYTVTGKHSSFPYLDLSVVGGQLRGLPKDLRGTSGSIGARLITLISGESILADAGDGGAGGAGLAIICRGATVGVSGSINLSGGSGGLGDTETIGGTDYRAGTGAPGGPGACLCVVDGSSPSLPDILDGFTAAYGGLPSAGTAATGESSASVLWPSGAAEPLAGFNTAIAGDVSTSMLRIQRLAKQQNPIEDVLVPAPKNFGVAINGAGTHHVLTCTLPPADCITEFVASITNDRGDAILIGSSTAGRFDHSPAPDTQMRYWCRNRNIRTLRVSNFNPNTTTSTFIGAPLAAGGGDGAPGADGADGDSVHTANIYRRAATQPATPTGGSFNFGTKVLSPPTNWSTSPPAVNGQKLWVSTGTFSINGTSGVDNTTTWATPTQFTQDGISGILTNDSHTVAAVADGTGYSLTGAGGTFQVYEGAADVTTSASFAVSGTATKNGLTIAINASSGVYSLSGASWTSDAESFTLRATYAGVTIDKVYSISKAKTGAGSTALATVDLSEVVGKTSTTTIPAEAYAGIRFLANGTWQTNNANDSSGSFSSPEDSGTWLVSGSASDCWIECESFNGSSNWQNSGINVRLRMNATRTWGGSTVGTGGFIPVTNAYSFKIYDAQSGGNLLDVMISPRGFTAIKTS